MHCYVILDNHIPSKHRNEPIMYGVEYERTNGLVANSFDTHVPCAVYYVPTRNALYMIPAKYECSSGWTRE